MNASDVYDLQQALEFAQKNAADVYRSVESRYAYDRNLIVRDERVIRAEAQVDDLFEKVDDAQAQIGGIIFCIARDNVPELEKRLASLNRKAAKLGCDPITLTLTDETTVLNYKTDAYSTRGYDFEHVYSILSGSAPTLPGFDLIAVLNHTEAGTLLSRVPQNFLSNGQIVSGYSSIDLAQYRDAPALCEHCNKVRSRNQTFLVHKHATNEIRQIGRTCLKDYTGGNDPEAIAKVLEYVYEWMRNARNSRGTTPIIRTEEILTHVCTMIRVRGYEKGMTKFLARENMDGFTTQQYINGAPTFVNPIQEDHDKALAVIEWAKGLTPTSDFMVNVQKVCTAEFAGDKTTGYLAYAPISYDKDRAETQTVKVEADFIGAVKERITRKFKVINVKSVRSDFTADGTKPLYLLEDEYGNPAKWFASAWGAGLQTGGEYILSATVKAHEDHDRFGKSTLLTRCKVAEVIKEGVA